MEVLSKLFDAFTSLKSIHVKILVVTFCFVTFIDVAFVDFINVFKLMPAIAFAMVYNLLTLLITALIVLIFNKFYWGEESYEDKIKDFNVNVILFMFLYPILSIAILLSYINLYSDIYNVNIGDDNFKLTALEFTSNMLSQASFMCLLLLLLFAFKIFFAWRRFKKA